MTGENVLLVDLNNFARYPTLPIGYLASVLRSAGMAVSVYAPLMVGVKGTTREARPGRFGGLKAQINYQFASSNRKWVRDFRSRVARKRHSEVTQHHQAVLDGFKSALERHRPEVVMVSTYLMYKDVCEAICLSCKERDIPVLIGGPYFVQPEVYNEWVHIPGLSALVAGELELESAGIVRTLLAGGDPTLHMGLLVSGENRNVRGRVAMPLKDLDRVPFPDFSDFPWELYPNRIIPIITGRGCGWGACSFCSDVISTAGRTYRSRSPDNVLDEIRKQYELYGVRQFVFTDLKLNSNPEVWFAILQRIQAVAPGCRWIASVHVGLDRPETLSKEALALAAQSGCVRLTTGLESGSQKILDAMKKGTRLELVEEFLRDAAQAGISCRVTMITGYPNETREDIDQSRRFLQRNLEHVERVMLNRLLLMSGTPLVRGLKKRPEEYGEFRILSEDGAQAQLQHEFGKLSSAEHRQAMRKLLKVVASINNRDLRQCARDFEGVM